MDACLLQEAGSLAVDLFEVFFLNMAVYGQRRLLTATLMPMLPDGKRSTQAPHSVLLLPAHSLDCYFAATAVVLSGIG